MKTIFIYNIIVISIIIIIQFFLKFLANQVTSEIESVIYVDKNYLKALTMLNSKRLKIVYRKSIIYNYKLDCLLLLKDETLINEFIDNFENLKMSKYKKINFYQKFFSYYCEIQNKEKASNYFEKLKNFKRHISNYEAVINEDELLYNKQFNKSI